MYRMRRPKRHINGENMNKIAKFLNSILGDHELPEEEILSENHKLSDQDVNKGKKSGKIHGDPIITFGND